MAIYSFKCLLCNASAEINIKITEDLWPPMCCHMAMQRDYTAPAVHFKGDGWGKDGAK